MVFGKSRFSGPKIARPEVIFVFLLIGPDFLGFAWTTFEYGRSFETIKNLWLNGWFDVSRFLSSWYSRKMGRSRGFSITQQTSKTLWKTSIIKQRLEKWMQCEKNRATFLFFFIVWYIPTIDAKTGLPIKYPSVERNRQNGSDQIRTFGYHFANHFITGATTRPK